ncbi:hypothetical protein M3Y94_00719600 [Aphelenchoides besseyi]|nr:hypothetical protein M3Y94_00719600 [Aphelenchoides besseyi]
MSATGMVCVVPELQEFTSSRRAGRRNAMHDLNIEGMDPIEAQKLAEQFAQMGHNDDDETGASTSKAEDK